MHGIYGDKDSGKLNFFFLSTISEYYLKLLSIIHIIFAKLSDARLGLVRPSRTPSNVYSNEKSIIELITVSTTLHRRECITLFYEKITLEF